MNFSRRQKIGGALLYLLLTLARLPELIAESVWFNLGFLTANAAAVIVIVWAVGKLYAAATSRGE